MEVKRASPSEGALRAGADPAAIARAYRGAADAISVLVDAPYFGGSFADLRRCAPSSTARSSPRIS
jgi:indole-3-glycerol phosphate synthase